MNQKRKNVEPIAQTLSGYVDDCLHILVLVYLFAILLALPLYFTKGYAYIGTDKADFFRFLIEKLQWFVIVLLGLKLFFAGLLWFQSHSGSLLNHVEALKQCAMEKLSVTDWFAGLFFVSILISYACSKYKETAKWGENGWYLGLIPLLAVMVSYFLISRYACRGKLPWGKILIGLGLLVSFGVYVLGILNRFGIRPFEMDYANYGFLSTVGNINWYCGYQVTIFFLSVGLLWGEACRNLFLRILLDIYTYIGFISLILQGSDSGMLALFGVFCLLFVLSCIGEKTLRRFWEIAGLFSLACLTISRIRKHWPDKMDYSTECLDLLTLGRMPVVLCVFCLFFLILFVLLERKCPLPSAAYKWIRVIFISALPVGIMVVIGLIMYKTGHPEELPGLPEKFFVISDAWGSNRGATWKAGWMCLCDMSLFHRLVGVGPDSMYRFLASVPDHKILEYCRSIFGDARLTNAHNEWLTILVNEGFIGLAGFGGMMISAMYRFLKRGKENAWVFGCGLCLFAHTINGVFSFQQTLNLTVIFVVLGFGEACLRPSQGR